jgi:hypothetical protein
MFTDRRVLVLSLPHDARQRTCGAVWRPLRAHLRPQPLRARVALRGARRCADGHT